MSIYQRQYLVKLYKNYDCEYVVLVEDEQGFIQKETSIFRFRAIKQAIKVLERSRNYRDLNKANKDFVESSFPDRWRTPISAVNEQE